MLDKFNTLDEYYAKTSDVPSALSAMKHLKEVAATITKELLDWFEANKFGHMTNEIEPEEEHMEKEIRYMLGDQERIITLSVEGGTAVLMVEDSSSIVIAETPRQVLGTLQDAIRAALLVVTK